MRYRQGAQERLRIFCLPHAGTGASHFRAWQRLMPDDVTVYGVQLPGRESRLREPPHRRLVELVGVLAEVIRPHLDVPFALFGHSMGSWISFELTRELRRRFGAEPVHLFLSGRRAPQLPGPHSTIHHLPDAAFIYALTDRYSGIPDAFLREPELLQIFLPTLRADLAMVETYRYAEDAVLECPVSVFGGLDDISVSRAELAAWRDQTRGPFRLQMFPGNHFFVQTAREALARTVAASLPAAVPTPPCGATSLTVTALKDD
ncbi:MAG: thioesterase II family protein [Chloroflexota bacterium]